MHTTTDPGSAPVSRRTLLRSATGAVPLWLAGCLGTDDGGNDSDDDRADDADVTDEFVFAATVRDDPDDVERDYAPLAEWVASETGVPARIDPVQDNSAAIGALAAGQAHAAYLSGGPAWVGWQAHGLETLVVEADEEGDTHYTAAAWVRADSGLESVADLEGVDSCHTGDLTGAGMLIPTAHLAHEGLVSFEEADDVTAIRDAVDEFFGDPVVGGGYVGALQCLSEGYGDVAFVRESTPAEYCDGSDSAGWCLDTDEYDLLEEFAEVPSHPIMASPEASEAEIELLRDALLELNDDPDGRAVLEEVLDAHQLKTTTSEEHLGPYGELIGILPGIEDHLVE
ncbi:phosphate/phosphite/phosphonate ABC transporter substrate-binding protein [Natrononativus amylolyticus]|uniref:phosphate/phosphite/phosphonate ABC transporter substrate-binding protein n=1 Tax=Natrononativus amylolyticus TaxID=2963434 RepID=UPI0020CC45F0|nr:PhnD/SsuA/transferrin family substrate-binding protein [Natrononativus amylolyticus]